MRKRSFWVCRVKTVRRNSLVPRCPPVACQRRWLTLLVVAVGVYNLASPERGDSPRGGEMPAGQRGPLSTRGTSGAGGGVPMQPFFDALDALDESLGMCRERCLHRPAGLTADSNFLGLPCRNRPAEFARCPRCPPWACQRRLLPLPVSVMLIFRCFPVQAVNFISYGVCKLVYKAPL